MGLAKGCPHRRRELEFGVLGMRALNEMISPFGRLWMYASSLVRRYEDWRWWSWLLGPYVENERFWTGGRGILGSRGRVWIDMW